MKLRAAGYKALLLGTLLAGVPTQAQVSPTRLVTLEIPTGKVPPGIDWASLAISPDGRHSAARVHQGKKWYIGVDGGSGKLYDAVDLPIFSPDSHRIAYAATLGSRAFMVVDGRELRPVIWGRAFQVSVDYPVFSPDSKKFGYTVRYFIRPPAAAWSLLRQDISSERALIEVNGAPQKVYDWVAGPFWSPDSRRLAYLAEKGKRKFLVLNGIEGKNQERVVSALTFSPNSRRLAFCGERGRGYDEHLALCDARGLGTYLVVDGREYPQPYVIFLFGLEFSPDSKRVAYAAFTRSGAFVVLDRRKEQVYRDVGWNLVFSPDSRKLAYTGLKKAAWVVVVNGKEEKGYGRIGDLVFSPNSRRLAYRVWRDEKWAVVADGVKHREYDGVKDIRFSPDSKRVAFAAKRGKKWFLVVDGIEGKPYDDITFGEKTPFDSPTSLHFLALQGNIGLRVRVRIL